MAMQLPTCSSSSTLNFTTELREGNVADHPNTSLYLPTCIYVPGTRPVFLPISSSVQVNARVYRGEDESTAGSASPHRPGALRDVGLRRRRCAGVFAEREVDAALLQGHQQLPTGGGVRQERSEEGLAQ